MNKADVPEVAKYVEAILKLMGEDSKREGLKETPERVAKAWLEMLAGYSQDPKEILSRTFDAGHYNEMIIVSHINFVSSCEHHLLPFTGEVNVGYIPKKRVVGASKIPRLVECFARRLQIQERMTVQIADSIMGHLDVSGVGVVVHATHSCIAMRGVKKPTSIMTTSCLLGTFHDSPAVRGEFLELIRGSSSGKRGD